MRGPAPETIVINVPEEDRVTHLVYVTRLGHVWQRLAISPATPAGQCIVVEVPIGRVGADGFAGNFPNH
jgi:hypothetical protein